MISNLPAPSEHAVSHVFISYKTEERALAQRVRTALALAAKCDVWWDQDLQTGGTWSADLDAAARDAACVVVLWSQTSTQSPWVQLEAAVAKAVGKLVPARLDDCVIPAPYQSIQTADLSTWNGREDHPEFAKLVRGVRACIDVAARRRPRSTIWKYPAMLTVSALVSFSAGVVSRPLLDGDPVRRGDRNDSQFDFDDFLARQRIAEAHAAKPEMFLHGELQELGQDTLELNLPAGACKTYLAVVPPGRECEISWWSNGPGARDLVVSRSGSPNVKTGHICSPEKKGMSVTVGLQIKMIRGSGRYALETYFDSQVIFDYIEPDAGEKSGTNRGEAGVGAISGHAGSGERGATGHEDPVKTPRVVQ